MFLDLLYLSDGGLVGSETTNTGDFTVTVLTGGPSPRTDCERCRPPAPGKPVEAAVGMPAATMGLGELPSLPTEAARGRWGAIVEVSDSIVSPCGGLVWKI